MTCQYKEYVLMGTPICTKPALYHVVFRYYDLSLYAMLWAHAFPEQSDDAITLDQELNVCSEHREEMLVTDWSLIEEIKE